MLLLTPEERARAWREAVVAEADEREFKRHMLAMAALQTVGSELSLYSDGHATALKESLDLLELSGLIGRDELREAFEEIDEAGTARAFLAALGRHLRETATVQWLDTGSRGAAAGLAERWRQAAAGDVADRTEDDGEIYITVAEVAALYDVTPQAVYKWIHRGVLDAHTRPGGSYQVPVTALASDERFDIGRARRLQQTLARRHEAQGEVSGAETVEQIRSRRRASQ